VFYRSRRIRQKYLIVFREWAKSLKTYKDITAILGLFYIYEVISEYAKSILACTENTPKGIGKEYFAEYMENTPIVIKAAYLHQNFLIINNLSRHERIGKTISIYCPFKQTLFSRGMRFRIHRNVAQPFYVRCWQLRSTLSSFTRWPGISKVLTGWEMAWICLNSPRLAL
jgi:hypothetical protein